MAIVPGCRRYVMAHPAERSRVKLHQHQESFAMFNEI
jgi:hypothetical protein